MDTKIEWCDVVWNPVTGCSQVGVGCKNCYAARMFKRLSANPNTPRYYGREFGDVRCHPELLDLPRGWKKPKAIFVNSMSDLFHEAVSFGFIEECFKSIARADWHTFIVLTKRVERMREFAMLLKECGYDPIPNLVLGVSCSTQEEVELDLPILLDTPAAKRIVSLEPLCCHVDFMAKRPGIPKWWQGALNPLSRINGVIVCGETGPGARPMHPEWVRSICDQCAHAGVSFFFKGWGEWYPAGKSIVENARMVVMGNEAFYRIGKRRSGRILDGVEHNALCWEVGQ